MTHTGSERTVADRLRAARGALRRWLLSLALLRVIGGAVAVFLLLALVDYLLRLPAWIRWVHFLGGLLALVWAWRSRVAPASSFSPSLSDLALDIERRKPELRDRLASALELDRLAHGSDTVESALARVSVRRLVPPTKGLLEGLLDRKQPVRATIALLVVVLAGVTTAALAPTVSRTAALRTAAPWSDMTWPKRTRVVDVTHETLHPRGEPIALRASLTRSNRAPDDTDVALRARVYRAGEIVSTARLLASWQQRGVREGAGAGGELFEVIADTEGDVLEYRFETIDDASEWTRIDLVERPAVTSATARIARPAYLVASAPADEPDAIEVDLGQGSDERAAAPASLSGSSVELELTLNKAIEPRVEDAEWMSETLGPHSAGVVVSTDASGSVWTVSFALEETRVFRVSLVDARGMASAEPAVFRFPAQLDQEPSVVVLDPAFDDTALPQATVRLAASGNDDVALAALWASAQRFSPEDPSGSGRGGAMAAAGDETVLERASVSAGDLRAEVASEIALSDLGAQPGDEVRLWATAIDVYAFETGLREPTRSTVRRVFIVSEDEFVDDVRGALSGVRRESIRLFENQRELAGRAQRDEASAEEIAREQTAITGDINRQLERLDALRERIDTNQLDDEALESLTRDASRIAQRAAESSEDAQDAARERDDDATARSQERALDDLGELIALLDSGEDAWSARRNIERLLREQLENLEETQELGRETAGLPAEELSDEQRERLERIAQRQSELAEQSRAAQEGLRDTEKALEESDPATSAALQQAAQSLEQSDVTRRMEEAAQQAEENRTSRSAALQQEAAEQLQEALEELDDAERARDEQLRRLAQSLVDTIRNLVAQQQDELARLARGEDGLDAGMIALHTRTLAAAETALGERELRGAARPLEDAAAAQLDAITALRAIDPDRDRARDAETESLARLREALEEAEKLQDEIERDAMERQREEIKEAYRQALEKQTALRDRTREAVPDGEIDRRARAALRRLSAEQSDLATEIQDLYAQTQELGDAVVFRFVHDKLAASLARSTDSLRDAEGGDALGAQTRSMVLLRSLIEALEEEESEDEQFDDGGGSGGGGSGGQQGGGEPELIPGGAQLKLLRAVQSDLLDRTRSIDEGRSPMSDLGSVGAEQRELSEIGQQLIDELMSQQNPPVIQEAPEEQEGDE